MKRLTLKVLISFLGTLAFLAACSDKSSMNALTEGDYNSEEFKLAKDDADSIMADMAIDDSESGEWLIWAPPTFAKPALDSVVYDSLSGWHQHALTFTDDYVAIAIIDSFRFTGLDSAYQAHWDSTTNVFERRLKKLFTLTPLPDSPGTFWTKSRTRNTHWQGLADTVTTLNGDFHRQWAGQSQGRSFTRDVQGELTDLKYYTADLRDLRPAHPFAGTLTSDLTLDVVRTYRQYHVEGTLTVTFRLENGNYCYHARLVRGNNWWEWDFCWP